MSNKSIKYLTNSYFNLLNRQSIFKTSWFIFTYDAFSKWNGWGKLYDRGADFKKGSESQKDDKWWVQQEILIVKCEFPKLVFVFMFLSENSEEAYLFPCAVGDIGSNSNISVRLCEIEDSELEEFLPQQQQTNN